MLMISAVAWLTVAAASANVQDPLSEREKIEYLIDHIANLEDAAFIRNGEEHSAEDAADHLRTKWRNAGSRVKTAVQFIEQVASQSSLSGDPYLIRFADGRDVKSGEYLAEILAKLETPVQEITGEDSSAAEEPATPGEGMKFLEPLVGDWKGTISGEGKDGAPVTIEINWKATKVFDGRWIRIEFTSTEEVAPAPGKWVEWEGLFTENAETGEIETIWMTPRLRVVAGESRFLDGRMIFFEKGRWDDAGRVLTLIAHKQNAADETPIEVKSTFTIAEDGQSFTVVDEEKQPDGSWMTSSTFRLQKVDS